MMLLSFSLCAVNKLNSDPCRVDDSTFKTPYGRLCEFLANTWYWPVLTSYSYSYEYTASVVVLLCKIQNKMRAARIYCCCVHRDRFVQHRFGRFAQQEYVHCLSRYGRLTDCQQSRVEEEQHPQEQEDASKRQQPRSYLSVLRHHRGATCSLRQAAGVPRVLCSLSTTNLLLRTYACCSFWPSSRQAPRDSSSLLLAQLLLFP